MLLVGFRNKALRKFQNAFIFNMAFADFIQGLIIMPSSLVSVYSESWKFDAVTCKLFAIIKMTITLVSVYSLSGISLQRYYYVVNRTQKLNNIRSAAIGITFVWILSMLMSMTPLFGWGVIGFEDSKVVCRILYHLTPSHTLTIFVTGLVINVTVMVVCYSSIFSALRSSTKQCNEYTTNKQYTIIDNNNGSKLISRNLNEIENFIKSSSYRRGNLSSNNFNVKLLPKEMCLLKTIFIVIAVFIFCWTPYVVFNTLRLFHIVGDVNIADTVTLWLGFCNSAVNPIIYGVLNKKFKKAMKSIIRCEAKSKFTISYV